VPGLTEKLLVADGPCTLDRLPRPGEIRKAIEKLLDALVEACLVPAKTCTRAQSQQKGAEQFIQRASLGILEKRSKNVCRVLRLDPPRIQQAGAGPSPMKDDGLRSEIRAEADQPEPPAEVHILLVEEKRFVEPADLHGRQTIEHHCAAGYEQREPVRRWLIGNTPFHGGRTGNAKRVLEPAFELHDRTVPRSHRRADAPQSC
jgi:hypothetical protein